MTCREAPPPPEGASPAHAGHRGSSLQNHEVTDFCRWRPACGFVFTALANEHTGGVTACVRQTKHLAAYRKHLSFLLVGLWLGAVYPEPQPLGPDHRPPAVCPCYLVLAASRGVGPGSVPWVTPVSWPLLRPISRDVCVLCPVWG